MKFRVRGAIGLAALMALGTRAGAELVLVDKDVAPIAIWTATQDKDDVRLAKSLAGYLKQMTGKEFPLKAGDPMPERAIIVGAAPDGFDEPLAHDAFAIRTDKQRLHLFGSKPNGAGYAVYALLEEHLGCRWWTWDDEDVPTNVTRLAVGELAVNRAPAFSMHDLWNVEAQTHQNNFYLKSRMTSWENFSGGHTLYPLLDGYAQKDNSIYPMNTKGERKYNNLHFCYMATNIVGYLVEALGAEVSKRDGKIGELIYFAGMGDWSGGMCECETCKAVYADELWTDPDGRKKPGYSATLIRMLNQAAEILDKKYPGIRVGTFAYMSLEAPPGKTVPGTNVVIQVPRLRHCTVHPAATCAKNASFKRNVERWQELAPGRVYIWEYGISYSMPYGFVIPFPCLYSMADNIKYYHTAGIQGVRVQGSYGSTGGDQTALKNYVWRKLLWNPALDPRELVKDFCSTFYGPAGDAMATYVGTLEASVTGANAPHLDEFAKSAKVVPPALLAQLSEARTAAVAAAGGQQPWDRRVREATLGVEVMRLDTARPFQETNGWLVPGGVETSAYARACDVARRCRNTGANEWGNGQSVFLALLYKQGSPVAWLEAGDLKVQVTHLNGQVRRLVYKGQDLLTIDDDIKARRAKGHPGYPMAGGTITRLSGAQWLSWAEPPTATRAVLSDALDLAPWKFSATTNATQTIELTGTNTWRTTLAYLPVRRAAKKDPGGSRTVTTTMFNADKTNGPLELAVCNGGAWQAVTFPASTNRVEVTGPGITGYKITIRGRNCAVENRTLTGSVSNCVFASDAREGTLSVAVTAFGDDTTPHAGPFLVHETTVMPVE